MLHIQRFAAAALLLLYASEVTANCTVHLNTPIPKGCFSSPGQLVDQGSYTYQSDGYCQCLCATANKLVYAMTKGTNCFCGDLLPPANAVATNSSCNAPCDGYPPNMCGGNSFFTVSLTGIESSVGNAGGNSASGQKPSSAQSQGPSVVTESGQVITVTAASSAQSGSGKPNKAGIAAGIVVGIVALGAIVGGAVLLIRRRKRNAVEEEYRRNAAVNQFVNGQAKSEASSTNDQRLDPSIMHHRRQSIGSIADERDFSRRILQVRRPIFDLRVRPRQGGLLLAQILYRT